MEKIILGYDINLGLPEDFNKKINASTKGYQDLTTMVDDFNARRLDFIFIPVGTLPYLNDYQIVSQAIFFSTGLTELTSQFITTKDINIDNVAQNTLGRVNKYCTTSYWAPMIYLMHYLPKKTVLHFQDTNGFKDLLIKTVKQEVAACMLWKIIIRQNVKLAEKAHTLFQLNSLTTPIIIANKNNHFPKKFREKINHFKTDDANSYFSGFTQPNSKSIRNFLAQIQMAVEHFDAKLV